MSCSTAVPESSRVWVSHGDSVERLPDCFEVLGTTDDCAVAAMRHEGKKIYGVQFHPEVTHTEYGQRVLRNFVRNVCRCESDWKPSSAETIEAIKADIRTIVGPSKNVLFFVSGGVDSTVAYKLCADALGQDRVHGVYVDTGFMRKNESVGRDGRVRKSRLQERAAARCLGAVSCGSRHRNEPGGQTKADRCRRFLPSKTRCSNSFPPGQWLLGQGTIYPDTIESGGTRESALIKTHHNRVPELLRRIQSGELVEPLVQFYKDEVREIGRALGLPSRLIEKQPFPGPGLAVRFLCTDTPAPWSENSKLSEVASGFNLKARVLPVLGVGVQGDERTYAHTALLTGDYDEARVAEVSPVITNCAARCESRRVLGGLEGIDRRVSSRADHDVARRTRCAARSGCARARHSRGIRHAEKNLAVPGCDASAEAQRGFDDRDQAR